ncbi:MULTISPECIES: Type 1 glutamine amidotransferase-like domain-containing protein [unclassified Isoptericola]|uniref:Type 1 glutamine amidotransferase-like domain-containing protein n=1 Tax=unclassified Isoptericola TaxID=2623355 RepID=UPI003648D0D0
MRLLLTSAGVRNATIHDALLRLLGRPVADCTAMCIPTALYGHPAVGPGPHVRGFVSGTTDDMTGLGWRSVGVLELTALPSIDADLWVPRVRDADVLLVAGGDALYLHHWMRESGFADLVPQLTDTVYVGMSAGSMVTTPRIGEYFVEWIPPSRDDATLGLVDFSIFPHLDHPMLPDNTLAAARRWAAGLGNAAYAVDDDTAITVVDGEVEVVSEGHWERLA